MKETTGELNATVVSVIAIAGLSAFFFTILWPSIQANNDKNMKCSVATCEKIPNDNGIVSCSYKGTKMTCPFKG